MTDSKLSALNVSVWRLIEGAGGFRYVVTANDPCSMLLEQAVQLRIQQGMTRAKAVKDANEYPTSVGLHSETKAIVKIRQEYPGMQVDQVFTERIPCWECQAFLNTLPAVRAVPYYHYVSLDRAHQKKMAGGTLAMYLKRCYGD